MPSSSSVELKIAGSAVLGIGVGYALARWRCAPAVAGAPAPAAIDAAANEPAAASEDNGARAVALLNDTATSVALGVASRTGLLDALLLAGEEAAGDDGAVLRLNAAELADLAARAAHEGEGEGGAATTSGGGLCARYVEEILAVLVTGGVVRLADAAADGDGGDGGEEEEELRFWLPATWRVALSSMGLYFEELPLLSQCAFAQVCDAAAAGGRGAGVAPAHYAAFGTWMGRLADEKHEAQLVQKLLPAISKAAAGLRGGGGEGGESGESGESGAGATATLLERLSSGDARVLDLGCGSGAAARLLARAFPQATVVGVDVDATAIARARAAAAQEEAPLPNLVFEVVDAAQLEAADGGGGGGGRADWVGSFDLVTSFDAIHDLTDPAAALRGARALLKPGGGGGGGGSGGVFAMVDIRAGTGLRANVGHGFAPFLYCVSLLHCMPQGLNDGGAGLGMMWGRGKALAMLRDAGFGAVEVLEPVFDAFNDCFLCRA
jgi:SAM-dependent methyltransferase